MFRASIALIFMLVIAGCAGAPPAGTPGATSTPASTSAAETPAVGSLTVYSGRSEELVGPLIQRFRDQTGIDPAVRYADTAQLAALLLEEGQNTPADVFFAQDAGALGAVGAADLLTNLSSATLERVPSEFRSPAGQWVGVSGRARVIAYDTRDVEADELPSSIDGFTDPQWRGRIGWAPTNGSFQSFVTAYRLLEGDDAAREWLEGIEANEPTSYDSNSAIVQAIADGEIDVGFVNHYYLLRFLAEQGDDFPVRNHFLAGADPGALVNVAGVAILEPSDNQTAAQQFVDFVLSDEAQAYFAAETHEYPLVEGVAGPEGQPPLADIEAPDIDLSDLADLQGTLELLRGVGALE